MSVRTAYRRLNEEGFRRRVEQIRSDMLGRTIGAICAISMEAVLKLRSIMSKPEAKDAVKLGVARTILEYQFKGIETLNLAARLDELERLVGEKKRRATKS